MAKAVFITRVDPEYDDIPEVQYHFPKTYLRQAQQAIGDWIVYYEPRRTGGRQAYFATARVDSITPDQSRPGHYYARLSRYLEFPVPVPFREGDHFYESGLRRADGGVNKGLFGRAVHLLPDNEYLGIVRAGMMPVLDRAGAELAGDLLVAEAEADYGRPLRKTVLARPERDRAFALTVREAYDATCAMTGIKLINGGGRCEIEAAHIRPVAEDGPDSPRNGLALSRTCHWMFDRGILSLEDDGRILSARRLVPEPVRRMLRPDGCAALPESRILAPHRQFLRYHREHVFKG